MPRKRRSRRDVPSFPLVRELVQRAHRDDEEARDVLHDALIERYGDFYLQFVHEAALISQHEPAFVVVRLGRLRSREAWVKRKQRGMHPIASPIPFEVTSWPMTNDVVTFVSYPRARAAARDRRRRRR